jgi:DNA repair protein NreA
MRPGFAKMGGGNATLPFLKKESLGASGAGFVRGDGRIDDPDAVVKDARCVVCRGTKLLCGKIRCPVLVRFYSQVKAKPLVSGLEMQGSSPPSVFVGRIGYPYVYVGPMIPPSHGDTEIMDTPEMWPGRSIEEIVDFRSQLVRGKTLVHIRDLEKNRLVEQTREIALSKGSAEVDARFMRRPQGSLVVDESVQPYGPSATLRDMRLGGLQTDHKIEKAYSDRDLKAKDAVIALHDKGVLVSRIQRAFSAGLFGMGKGRKFVPTRWSITAVDDTLSKNLVREVKEYPLINEYRVYEHTALDNKWIVLMLPEPWSYEQYEAWYPGTTWNTSGEETWMISDWEPFEGRTTYALPGGCYYSTRLAIGERLTQEKRQAAVITLREIHPGYILPVGVWHTRESIRAALAKPPMMLASFDEMLRYAASKLDIPIKRWVDQGHLLRRLMDQRKLADFFARRKVN